jgi:asparagine synthase (glutamine-hydrolysing)
VEHNGAVLGQIWSKAEDHMMEGEHGTRAVLDGEVHNWYDVQPGATSTLEALKLAYFEQGPGFVERLDGHFALAIAGSDGVFLARDPVGVVPLYYSSNGSLAFASEVKAMQALGETPVELPPGHYLDPVDGLVQYDEVAPVDPVGGSPDELAAELRHTLVAAIAKRATSGETGAWLSGGVDSSIMATLARRQLSELKTFAAGLDGAPDLMYARMVADHIGSDHYECIVSPREMLELLPEVIFHLESFDALLVRSSIMNFAVGRLASEHVAAVLSGEGADELFAGYSYLKDSASAALSDELVDITNRLHNTALQRVDRCSKAHGLIAHVPFLDQAVVSFALSIPTQYKLNREAGMVEKWILRRAVDGMLPDEILTRPKAKFWEGAGALEVLSDHAEMSITDADFRAERTLPDGGMLNTKEEVMYYRVFCEHFGVDGAYEVVGRTKGAPVDE